jgi:hypothetical protein
MEENICVELLDVDVKALEDYLVAAAALMVAAVEVVAALMAAVAEAS